MNEKVNESKQMDTKIQNGLETNLKTLKLVKI